MDETEGTAENGAVAASWWTGSPGDHEDREDRAADRLLGPAAVQPPDVLARLILAAGGMRSPTGVRNRAMLTVLRYTGVRASELVAIRPGDVRLEGDRAGIELLPGLSAHETGGRVLLVRGKGTRSRLVPLHPAASSAFDIWGRWRAVWAPGARCAFCTISQPKPGRRLTREYVWRVTRRAANRAGLGDVRAHPHMFRASLAVELNRAGVPVTVIRDLLGHRNLGSTDAYLRRVDPGDVRRALEALA